MSDTTQELRVLNAIKDAGKFGVENWKLSRLALKYTSVISQLRKEGYNIYAERQTLKNGRPSNTWKYFLNGKKRIEKKTPAKRNDRIIKELMIAKSKGRLGCYKYINDRLNDFGA